MKNYIYAIGLIIFLVLVVAMIVKKMQKKKVKSGNKTLEQMYKDGDEYLLIDVRTPQEYGDGHIVGAINIPYDEIATKMVIIP
jgi:3-mercaptopyruvate sulfurtransferase SseA